MQYGLVQGVELLDVGEPPRRAPVCHILQLLAFLCRQWGFDNQLATVETT
jgi:3-deoxy-D-manno-octulosonic acid (KDO) 8-phosphate synthase